jgi:hypothetical protein
VLRWVLPVCFFSPKLAALRGLPQNRQRPLPYSTDPERPPRRSEDGRFAAYGGLARYRETMKHITVSLDEATYCRARMIAARRGTSVSALVRQFLVELAASESEAQRLKRLEAELRDGILDFNASDSLSRDDVHRRDG